MNFTQRRERFRAVLEGNECVCPAPVHDPISAVIAEYVGFEVGLLPGPIAQAVLLAAPNHHIVTLTLPELAEHVRHICQASTISLYAGAFHGFGNAMNVIRTVQEMEMAGVSCLTIDDQIEPVPFGAKIKGRVGQRSIVDEALIPLDEAVGRMKAAVAARQDPSLVVAARNSAILAGDIPEAVRRARAYEKAGVDAIHLDGIGFHPRGAEGLEAVHAATKLPILTAQEADIYDLKWLGERGVRVGQHGNLTLRVAVKAMYDCLKALRQGKSTKDLESITASPDLLSHAVRGHQFDELFQKFM